MSAWQLYRQCLTPSATNVIFMQIRWAGHNKWSNIRHIKAEKDAIQAKKNSLYSNKIALVLKETKNNTNLETNSSLRKLVEEALAQNVPKASVDKMVKRSNLNEELASEHIVEIRGPGRVGIIVECLVKSKGLIPVKLNPILRKHGSQEEKGILNMFDKKGVILATISKDKTFDDVETDAIEVGAEEVNLIDEETRTVEFVTQEDDFSQVKGSLTKAGYDCQDASIAFIPNVEITPNGLERKMLDKMVDLMMAEAIVTNVHTNAS